MIQAICVAYNIIKLTVKLTVLAVDKNYGLNAHVYKLLPRHIYSMEEKNATGCLTAET
jgi:hypothetical protein